MAGHSKWANIKHRKGSQDARRGRIFAKLSKEITVAALKGIDPALNPALRLAITKAKSNSMPKKTIENAINKAVNNSSSLNFKELVYGANVSGVSFLIICLTDNVNRTQADVQHLISRFNGTLSNASAVTYAFDHLGMLELNISDHQEEEIISKIISLGALDFESNDGKIYIYTTPQTFSDIKTGLENAGISNFGIAEVRYIAKQEIALPKPKTTKILELINSLEENDDVQDVYHNLDANSFS